MSEERCPYFSRSVAEIALPGHQHPLRLPVCRCALTEVLIERLEAEDSNEELVSYFRGPSVAGQPRPVIGSDLQVISPATCTQERLRERCLPSFVSILTDVGLDASVPPED